MFEEENDNSESIKNLPIYKKALEILDLILKISDFMEDEAIEKVEGVKYQLVKFHIDDMMENAYIIPAKISGASAVELYDIKMENAALIRKAARQILVGCNGFKDHGFQGLEYLELLRSEIDEFRILFAEWVKTFNPWDYIIDRWGLFNPPGVSYDDHDPDDDL